LRSSLWREYPCYFSVPKRARIYVKRARPFTAKGARKKKFGIIKRWPVSERGHSQSVRIIEDFAPEKKQDLRW